MIVVKSPNTVTSRKVKEAITICSEYDIYNAQQQPKPQLAKIEKVYLIDKSEVSKYLSRWKNFQMYEIETDIGIFITGRNGYPKQNNCNWNSGPKKGGKDIDWKQKEGEIVSVITGPSKANGWNWIYFVHDFEKNISADKNIKEIPSTQLISEHLIKRYMSNFFGYGNLKSDYWFIGIEEGGGKTEREVIDRIKTWKMFGENTVEDLAKFHKKINNPLAEMGGYFPLTWQSYIRIVFALNADKKFFNLNKNQQRSEMKRYVENGFANDDGNECLLEIGPLPSPTVAYWNYEKYSVFSDIEELADRKTCMDHYHPKRREKIASLIDKEKPKYVFFMSDRQQLVNDHWMKIIGSSEEKMIKGFDKYNDGDRPRHFINNHDINFIICKHPDAQKHLLSKKGVSKHLIEDHIHSYYDLLAEYLLQDSLLKEKIRHISNEAMHYCLEALRPFVESNLEKFYPGKDWRKISYDTYHSEHVGNFLEYEKNKNSLAWDLLALLNVIDHRAFAKVFHKNLKKPEFATIKSYCATIKNFRNTSHAHSKGELSIDTVEYLILSMVHLSEHLNSERFSNKVKYLKSELSSLK